MPGNPGDTLEQIRSLLSDLPERLAAILLRPKQEQGFERPPTEPVKEQTSADASEKLMEAVRGAGGLQQSVNALQQAISELPSRIRIPGGIGGDGRQQQPPFAMQPQMPPMPTGTRPQPPIDTGEKHTLAESFRELWRETVDSLRAGLNKVFNQPGLQVTPPAPQGPTISAVNPMMPRITAQAFNLPPATAGIPPPSAPPMRASFAPGSTQTAAPILPDRRPSLPPPSLAKKSLQPSGKFTLPTTDLSLPPTLPPSGGVLPFPTQLRPPGAETKLRQSPTSGRETQMAPRGTRPMGLKATRQEGGDNRRERGQDELVQVMRELVEALRDTERALRPSGESGIGVIPQGGKGGSETPHGRDLAAEPASHDVPMDILANHAEKTRGNL